MKAVIQAKVIYYFSYLLIIHILINDILFNSKQ